MPRPKAQDREPSLVVELRASIDESGANPYRLAEKAGIDESAIRKFIARTRSLSLDSAARLVEVLGMRILRPTKPRRFAGRSRSRAVGPVEALDKVAGELLAPDVLDQVAAEVPGNLEGNSDPKREA
jgi:predicted transcriptional regulator